MRKAASRAFLFLCLTALPAASMAADEVVLANGQVLEVESYRHEGDAVVLLFEGGGTLALLREHVRSYGELSTAPPATPPAESEPSAGSEEISPLDRLIRDLALRYEVDPLLVAAVIQVESMWDPDAVSPKGAMGLMQLMPATARGHGVTDPFDPAQNVEAGVRELADQLRRHDDEIALALAAYNAGGVAVKRYQGIPPYRETIQYVRKVTDLYYSWAEEGLVGGSAPPRAMSGKPGR
jgi:soluble lytic murein transglycosylase-like protein